MTGTAADLTPLVASLAALGAAAGLLAWLRPRTPQLGGLAEILGILCLAAAIAIWLLRWWEAGHLPLFGTYEGSLSLALAVLAAALVARFRLPPSTRPWPVACAITAALLIHGLQYDKRLFGLTISERSLVVDLHALLAWAAFGTLAVNAGLALLLIASRAPGVTDARRALAFSLKLGFFLHSAMLASGSFYKFLLFGTAWSFDPIETLGFVAWIAYGTLLHLHLIAGWSGRRLARWCLGLFLLLVVSYRGIVYFPAWSSYHIFDMDLRIHLTGPESPAGEGP